MQSNGESQYSILKRWGESDIDLVTWCDTLRNETRRSFLTFLEVHYSAHFTVELVVVKSTASFCPEKWNILQTFPAHGDKDPKSTFTLIKGRPDRTGGKTGRKLLFWRGKYETGFRCYGPCDMIQHVLTFCCHFSRSEPLIGPGGKYWPLIGCQLILA